MLQNVFARHKTIDEDVMKFLASTALVAKHLHMWDGLESNVTTDYQPLVLVVNDSLHAQCAPCLTSRQFFVSNNKCGHFTDLQMLAVAFVVSGMNLVAICVREAFLNVSYQLAIHTRNWLEARLALFQYSNKY